MSNYLSLAAVTAAFGRTISHAIQAVPNLSAAPELRIGRPPLDSAFVGANLFLYRAMPSRIRRNDDLATRAADGTVTRRPQAALDLDYLVSFYGSDAGLEPYRLMGSVIALLHAFPVLTAADIRAAVDAVASRGILAGADLDAQVEPVRFTLAPLDLDNLHRVWSLFQTVPYAISVAYTGSTILLDADVAPARAPPARVAVTAVRPALPPRIESLAPPVVPFGAGATLTVAGTGFGAAAEVRFGAIEVPAVALAGSLVAPIPAGLRAGVNSVRVVTMSSVRSGSPPAESAEAVFVLQPRVADGALYRVISDPRTHAPLETIVVNVAPTPGLSQPAQLFLNPMPLGPSGRTPRGSVTALRFAIDGFFAADLDRGAVTPAIRSAFAVAGITLGPAAVVTAEPGLWRLSDAEAGLACRLERDGDRIAVHYGLAANDVLGMLAFQVRDIPPGPYLVSVQIGDHAAATSPMRWGRHLLDTPASPSDVAADRLPATISAAFKASGTAVSDRLAVSQPMAGDGFEIRDESGGRSYWASFDGHALSLFELDVPDSTFIGPVVSVPEPGGVP